MSSNLLPTDEMPVAKTHSRGYAPRRPTSIWGLSDLPSHWREKPLKHLARINPDKLADDTDPDFEMEYVDIGNVTLEAGIGSTEKHRFEVAPSRARRLVRDGDTIVSTVRTYLKAVAPIANPPDNLVVSTGFAVLRPGPDLVPGYLFRLAQSDVFVQRIMAHSVGVSYPAINASDIGKFAIPVPPLGEQRAIAAFLDRETAKIDELIAKKQRLIEHLEGKRKGVVAWATTKGLNGSALMKDSGIPWFGLVPRHWEVRRLGWVCEEISDINHEMPASVEAGVPFLSAKDLFDDGSLNFERDVKTISEEDFHRLAAKSRPRRHDIIYSRIGACLGKARIVETDVRFLVSYSCCVVRLRESIADSAYYRHLLDTDIVLTEAKMRTQGIGVPDLGLNQIGRFPVPVPPIDEQRQIAAFLNESNNRLRQLIEKIERGIGALREYRSSLISAAVTGRIDVRHYREEASCP